MVDHCMNCPAGGYPSARHDEVRDILADVLLDVVQDVEVEPLLTPLAGEQLVYKTANTNDDARVDIRARGFWTRQQNAFFDVRVTHPKASLLSRSEVASQLRNHENMKRRTYLQRIVDVERGSFTPLVFTTNGQCGRECSAFIKALVQRLVQKNADLVYSRVMNRLRSKLSFALLRWQITCLRGSRPSYRRNKSGDLPFVARCRLASRR